MNDFEPNFFLQFNEYKFQMNVEIILQLKKTQPNKSNSLEIRREQKNTIWV